MIVISSLLMFNALLLIVVGFVLAWFMERPAGILAAVCCWLAAGALLGLVSFADRFLTRR